MNTKICHQVNQKYVDVALIWVFTTQQAIKQLQFFLCEAETQLNFPEALGVLPWSLYSVLTYLFTFEILF